MSKEIFKCHSVKQQKVIFSDHKITAAITGIQFGKTTMGAWWLKRKMFERPQKDANFIITAPTYKIMNQSTIPAFLKIMSGFGEYKVGPAEFHMNGGGICYMRTGTDPDSIVGITDVYGIWGDEAGKYSLYFWENIQGRAAFKNAPIVLTSTPYAMNWFYKEILKPYKSGEREDILVVQAKSCDNPYFPMEEYERRRKTMDARRFNAMFNGEFEKMHGLVYDCFDEGDNICDPFDLPIGTKFYAGVDWGTTHPFVIVVRAVTPSNEHFQVAEFYKTGYTLMDMLQVAKGLKQIWGIQIFYCDPSEPGYIEEFNRHGLSALKADNDIRRGIDLHYSLMKQRRFKIFRGSSPYTLDEIDSYHYPEPKDLSPDMADKEQTPVDQSNHCCDAMRYATIMTYHEGDKKSPMVPQLQKSQESNLERIRRLKRRNDNRKTEKWS